MKRRENKSIFIGLLLVVFMLLLPDCGGGGGGGGGGNPAAGVCMNVAGVWTTTEQVNSTTCASGVYTEGGSYAVAQSGCSLTVQDSSGNTFTGSINGAQITWSGSYPDAGGTTAINSMTLNVAADGTSFNGSCAWTWNGAGSACSGTTSVTGSLANSNGGVGADTTAPSVPTGLTATAASTSQIDLSWTASTDNGGVTGYKVYTSAGSYVKSVAETSTSMTGLAASTLCCYKISAYDAAGNESVQSTQACATTQSVGGANTAPNIVVTDSVAPDDDRMMIYGNIASSTISDQNVTVTNTGSDNLVIGSASGVTTPFSITADSCTNQTLAPAASCAMTVRFAPKGGGTFSQNMSISINNPDEPAVTVSLGGTSPNVMFISSISGNGDMSTWPGAGSNTGLAAADAVCQSLATAAGRAGTYIAWLSDDADDAYCRIHGVSGKKSSNCGGNLPAAKAGPWIRTDGYPFGGNIDQLLGENGQVYTPARFDENGNTLATSTDYVTSTYWDGALPSYTPAPCSNFTSSNSLATAPLYGLTDRTTTYWTWYSSSTCDNNWQILCFQTGTGTALPAPTTTGKKVFLTSVTGNGNLGSWQDAIGAGQSGGGLAAGDAICRARATAAGLANAANFKAWLSDASTNAKDRLSSDGPWVRLDGIPIATSKADLTDGLLFAPINLSETSIYFGEENAWTGTSTNGLKNASTCSNWTDGTSTSSGIRGIASDAASGWSTRSNICSRDSDMHLYCFED